MKALHNLMLVVAVGIGLISRTPSLAQTGSSPIDFLSAVPKAHTEIFAINDLAAHVEWVLQNKSVRRFLESEAFGETPNGPNLRPERLLEQLEASRPFYPKHVVVSGDESTYLMTANLLRTLYRLNMAITVSQAAVQVPREDLETLTEEILVDVRELKLPSLCVCVRWEDESTATLVFAMLNEQKSMLEQQLGLPIKSEQGAMSLSMKIGDLVDVDQIGLVLGEWGIMDSSDSIANSVLRIQLDIRVERIRNGLRIILGKQFSENWKRSELTIFEPKPDWIAMGRWDLTKMKQVAREFDAVASKWKQTELGKASDEFDLADSGSDMESGFKMIGAAPDSGFVHAWRTDNSIRAKMDLYGKEDATPLAGNPILDLIPAEAGWFHVDARTSFTTALANWLSNSEGRMATNVVTAELSGDEVQSKFQNDLYDGYFLHFAPWRDLIRNQLPEHELVPWAIVGLPGGQLDQLSIEITSISENPVRLTNQPVPQIAVIAKLPNAQEVPKLFESAFQAFAESSIRATGAEVPDSLATIAKSDLGLGLPTTEFSMEWLNETSIAKVQFQGDFRPHYVVRDGFLLLSSSPDLTKLILNRERKSISLGSGSDRIVARGTATGEALAADVVGVIELIFRGLSDPQLESAHFKSMLGLMRDMVRIVKVVHWRTTSADQVQTSEIIIELSE